MIIANKLWRKINKECYPCIKGKEWNDCKQKYREMPLCQVRSELFKEEERLARMECNSNVDFISLLIALGSLLFAIAAPAATPAGDYKRLRIIILVCIVLGFKGLYNIAFFDIKHRQVHLRVACIREVIKERQNYLQKAIKKRTIKLTHINPTIDGYCEKNPDPIKWKWLRKLGQW